MQQEYQIKYLRAAMRDLEGIAQLYLVLAGADSAENSSMNSAHRRPAADVSVFRRTAPGYGAGGTGIPEGYLPRLCVRLQGH